MFKVYKSHGNIGRLVVNMHKFDKNMQKGLHFYAKHSILSALNEYFFAAFKTAYGGKQNEKGKYQKNRPCLFRRT